MKTLVIAPHPDDEVLGCGGLIAKRVREGDDVRVCIVSEGLPPIYSRNFASMEAEETDRAQRILGYQTLKKLGLPCIVFPNMLRSTLNALLKEEVLSYSPDEVFIPHFGDIHLDHRTVSEAAMVALRPKTGLNVSRVLAYEVVSETGWNVPNPSNAFVPNVFEDISGTLQTKLDALLAYKSQVQKFPEARSYQAVSSLATFRGTTANMNAAEAFMLIREVKK